MNVHLANTRLHYQLKRLVTLSQEFLLAVKTKQPASLFPELLKNLTAADMKAQLQTDDEKKAFWINLYNAYIQVFLTKNPGEYKKRSSFFRSKQILIAGNRISLDNIEHGILRRSKVKWAFGYLNKIFPSRFEKENRVNILDYRIHFALNCGAASCPPIAFYDPSKLNSQLDLATRAYLTTGAKYDPGQNIITLPATVSWFRADFGGNKNIISLVRQLGIVPNDKKPAIHFNKYNWKIFLENYKTESNE